MDQTEGFSVEQAAADELSLGKVTATGVGGVAFDASSQRIIGVATPTAGTDAANKDYVDAVATGLDWKNSVRVATNAALPAYTPAGAGVGKTLTANANGALTVDGVSVAVGNRILVKSEGVSHADHGIYTVTAAGDGSNPWILTRATDADQNAEVTAGLAVFATEGTANADTGWVLVTDDPITIDTTALSFSQFSSTVSYTFDQGLSNTSGSIKVELDTAAGAQTAGAGGGSSGLEFDVNTASGKLRAAVNGTGGLERSASGLAVLKDPTANTAGNNYTLASSASGLAVLRAPKTAENYAVSEAVAAGDPVAWSTSTNNQLVKSLANNDAKSRVIGVASTAAGSAGQTVDVVTAGVAAGVLSGATVGTPYYLATAGGLSTSLPGSGQRVIQVGFAKNASDLFVRVVDYGKKA
jgi:hypothetical protein